MKITTALLLATPIASALSLASLQLPHTWSRARRISSRADQNATTVPAAIEIAPSQYWDGDDGPWSSFAIQVGGGTQPQVVRVFPSNAAYYVITVGPEGCPAGFPDDCEMTRGGFYDPAASLTYVANSIYELGIEQNLGYNTDTNVGFDTVTLGWQGAGGPAVDHVVVYNTSADPYWLGIFGLSPLPSNFSNLNDPQPSFMQQLVNRNKIPSLTYGYTAGNQYRLNKVYGSLVLGGYDQNRFDNTKNVSIGFYPDINRDLLVNIQSISTDAGSPSNLLPDGPISAYIDSTIAQLWLPESACAAFEQAFGITYDEGSALYLVNSSLHETLLGTNPNVTFTIGSQSSGGPTLDIVFPYRAFDLNATFPYVYKPNAPSNSSYYFPLQRAANDTQYTLGRTFLQEAYLIADYDNSNFTIAPCIWDADKIAKSSIVSMLRANETSHGDNDSTGAIAGGVVGGVVGAVLIGGVILWLLRRRKRTEKKRLAELEAKDANNTSINSGGEAKPFISAPIGGELSGQEIHELNAPYKPSAHEMDSPYRTDQLHKHGYSEMEGGGEYFAPSKNDPSEVDGSTPIFEMPGSDVHEMPIPDAPRVPPK